MTNSLISVITSTTIVLGVAILILVTIDTLRLLFWKIYQVSSDDSYRD